MPSLTGWSPRAFDPSHAAAVGSLSRVERGLRKPLGPEMDPRLRLRAVLASSRIAVYQGEYAAAAQLTEALAGFEDVGDQAN